MRLEHGVSLGHVATLARALSMRANEAGLPFDSVSNPRLNG